MLRVPETLMIRLSLVLLLVSLLLPAIAPAAPAPVAQGTEADSDLHPVRLADTSLPGNRLEALRGKRSGQHSIRINGQYRLCLEWRSGDAHKVEIVDYH